MYRESGVLHVFMIQKHTHTTLCCTYLSWIMGMRWVSKPPAHKR
jgi:hypothetical protein